MVMINIVKKEPQVYPFNKSLPLFFLADTHQIKTKSSSQLLRAEVPIGGSPLAGGRSLDRSSVRKSLRDSASVLGNKRIILAASEKN